MRDRVRVEEAVSRSLVPPAVLGAMIQAAKRAPMGDIVEVGVYQGGSAFELNEVAFHKGVKLHLFDTFEGMPIAWPGDSHAVGDFADTSLEAVQRLVPEAICYKGVFPHTLPHSVNRLGFVHCDVDQYRCTRDVIVSLWWRLVSGGIMWFDDMELPAARQAVEDTLPPDIPRHEAPEGRRYAVKP
jgi:hypothetical protein